MTERLDYDAIRGDTVRQVAKLMAASAITAPKSGGQLFLQGKHLFIETVIVDDTATLHQLAGWLRARGKERREAIWFRDADVAEAVDAVLFVGLADWYPANYDCGACGYATCAEFLHAHQTTPRRLPRPRVRRPHRKPARHRLGHRRRLGGQDRRHPLHRLPLPDPHRRRARKLGIIHADIAVALPSRSPTRPSGSTGESSTSTSTPSTSPPPAPCPSGIPGATRADGARNRQQPRTPIRPADTTR